MRAEYAVTPALSVSFQRYRYPASGSVDGLPRSAGAAPLQVSGPGRLIVASPAGEALWIGLIPEPAAPASLVTVLAVLLCGRRVDAVSGRPAPDSAVGPQRAPGPAATTGWQPDRVRVPPQFELTGIGRGDGTWWALGREPEPGGAPPCRRLVLSVRPAARAPGDGSPTVVRVDLVTVAVFTAATGLPVAPLDDDGSYQGHRLP